MSSTGRCSCASLKDLGECRRGFMVGSIVSAIAILVVWSGVLYMQVLQAHRIPVQTTQYHRLDAFPSTGVVVVSKFCSQGPPFAAGEAVPETPAFDFATVTGLSVAKGTGASVQLQRPDPQRVLWKQHRVTFPEYGQSGKRTCAFTAAAFLHAKSVQCLTRTVENNLWVSEAGWQACEGNKRYEPMVGLSAGNWSTSPKGTTRGHSQGLPSWPSGSFFIAWTPAEELRSLLGRVDGLLQRVAGKETDADTLVAVQDSLSTEVPGGVWLFQATNMDPFANIGPQVVTLHSTRCEGVCDAETTRAKVHATLEAAPPMWRQPLCDPSIQHMSSHQGCVPIVAKEDLLEAVVVSTVAFRWPNLVAQWLSPLVVLAVLFPVLAILPIIVGLGKEQGTDAEVRKLVVGSAVVGRPPQLDDDV